MSKVRRVDAEEKRRQGRRLSSRGADLMRKGQVATAIRLLVRAAELIPDDAPTAINLGGALVMLKRYDEATPILERARDLVPNSVTVWINLGAAYLGELESADDPQQRRAIAAFEHALALDPIAPSVHYNLGLIHRQRGEIAQAIQRFYQAVQANPLDRDARRAWQRLEHEKEQD